MYFFCVPASPTHIHTRKTLSREKKSKQPLYNNSVVTLGFTPQGNYNVPQQNSNYNWSRTGACFYRLVYPFLSEAKICQTWCNPFLSEAKNCQTQSYFCDSQLEISNHFRSHLHKESKSCLITSLIISSCKIPVLHRVKHKFSSLRFQCTINIRKL